ncbi:hypothetical protein VTO42DRAFT_497 [Malbranchea cinnamomea]
MLVCLAPAAVGLFFDDDDDDDDSSQTSACHQQEHAQKEQRREHTGNSAGDLKPTTSRWGGHLLSTHSHLAVLPVLSPSETCRCFDARTMLSLLCVSSWGTKLGSAQGLTLRHPTAVARRDMNRNRK